VELFVQNAGVRDAWLTDIESRIEVAWGEAQDTSVQDEMHRVFSTFVSEQVAMLSTNVPHGPHFEANTGKEQAAEAAGNSFFMTEVPRESEPGRPPPPVVRRVEDIEAPKRHKQPVETLTPHERILLKPFLDSTGELMPLSDAQLANVAPEVLIVLEQKTRRDLQKLQRQITALSVQCSRARTSGTEGRANRGWNKLSTRNILKDNMQATPLHCRSVRQLMATQKALARTHRYQQTLARSFRNDKILLTSKLQAVKDEDEWHRKHEERKARRAQEAKKQKRQQRQMQFLRLVVLVSRLPALCAQLRRERQYHREHGEWRPVYKFARRIALHKSAAAINVRSESTSPVPSPRPRGISVPSHHEAPDSARPHFAPQIDIKATFGPQASAERRRPQSVATSSGAAPAHCSPREGRLTAGFDDDKENDKEIGSEGSDSPTTCEPSVPFENLEARLAAMQAEWAAKNSRDSVRSSKGHLDALWTGQTTPSSFSSFRDSQYWESFSSNV